MDKMDQVSLLCQARDSALVSYVCTFAKGWKDGRVTDVDKYRSYLLDLATKYEGQRAIIVGQDPTSVIDLAEQMTNAIKRHPRWYLNGLLAEF